MADSISITNILVLIILILVTVQIMAVFERVRNSKVSESESKEARMSLDALCESFVAVILIDLVKQKETVIKASPYLSSLLNDKVAVRDNLIDVFAHVAVPEHFDELKEFADLNTLNERMAGNRSISKQYCSKGIGWSVVSFIVVERDDARDLKKVIVAVSSIEATKKREIEYEEALSRAYDNENAILAELVKMQATGMVASIDRRIIVVNDAALEIFGQKGTDPIGSDVIDFWNKAPIKIPDDKRAKSHEIEAKGGSFSYETVSYNEGDEENMRYLRVDVRRVDLLDGSHVMLTGLTDVTTGKLLEDRLRTISEKDSLTDIANRRSGESRIRLLLRQGVGGTFCLFNINGFRNINEQFGQQEGDDTLIAVANAAKSSFRSDDVIMRLSGDEFAIYIRGVDTEDLAKIKISRLLENISRIELGYVAKGSVSISLGAVVVKGTEDGGSHLDYEEIYKLADDKMKECKGKPGSNMIIHGV